MRTQTVAALILVSFAVTPPASSAPTPQFVTQIGTDARGVALTDRNYYSGRDALSSDGRWLVYSDGGVWRKDLRTGKVDLVSTNWLTGEPAGGENASISDDGNLVCFETWEGSNVPGDTNFAYDVFLRDMTLGVTLRINPNVFGGQPWGPCYRSTMSRDGSTIVYESPDPAIVPGDFNNWRDFFAYDVATGTTELISADLFGQPGQYEDANCSVSPASPCNWAGVCSVSGDGRYVAFASRLKNLVPGGTAPWGLNVFVRDRLLGVTELASVNNSGQEAHGFCWNPAISADGRYVAFLSWADNLVPGAFGESHVYVRDRVAGTVHWVDQSAMAGVHSNPSSRVSISGDGMWVGYSSDSDDLVPGDTNSAADAFATHWRTGATRLLSRSTTGQSGFQYGQYPVALTWNGSRSAFVSTSNDLVVTPPNDTTRVYLRDERVQSVPVVAYCTSKTNSLGCQPAMSTSGICSFTRGTPFFITSQFERSHQPGMMVWSTAPAALPFSGGVVCVQLPMQRTPLQSTGGASAAIDCTGTGSYVFTPQYAHSRGLAPGDTVYAQYWTRDPLASQVRNVNTSNAIAFTWAP